MIRMFGILTAMIFVFPPAAGAADLISDILSNPTVYDTKHVEISGTITGLEQKISAKGNDYDIFSICGGGCIHVFTFGRPEIANGGKLTVSGTFSALKHVGSYTFRNEIEADEGTIK